MIYQDESNRQVRNSVDGIASKFVYTEPFPTLRKRLALETSANKGSSNEKTVWSRKIAKIKGIIH